METIEVYELKVCAYSILNEYKYMNTFEYQRSLFDLCPRSLRFIHVLSNVCCKAAGPIEAKFYVEHLWVGRMKLC